MTKLFVAAVCSLCLCIAGCAQIQLAAVNALALKFEGKRFSNIAYGDLAMQKLDIYQPYQILETGASLPVIVFLHGGSWRDGNKNQYRFVGVTLAAKGFVVVVPNYRKFPDVVFPEFIDDAARAVAWVNDHIADYGGDLTNVYISGHSSGAHMGALLLADRRYLAKYGHSSSQVRGFVGLAGPYSFTPREPDIVEVFGDLEDFSQMQVDTFLDGNEPPMFLLHGLDDQIVGRINIERVEAAAEKVGGDISSKYYPGLSHAGILGEFAAPLQEDSMLVSDMVDFFQTHSR